MKILQKKQQPNRRATSSQGEGRASAEDLSARYAFRRNRTLTGSLSSDVASASERTAELRSSRVEVHHLRRHRKRLALVLLGVILIICSLAWLIYQSIATVSVVIVDTTTPPVDTAIYERGIQEYLNNHPLERNRATLDTDALTVYLQDNGLPEVLAVGVQDTPSGLGASTLRLTTRTPVVAWKTNAAYLYVDSTGVAFSRNYHAAPQVAVVDQTGIQATDNQVLASSRFLGFIGRVIGQLSTQGLTATQAVLPANTARQVVVSVEGVPYPIKFSADRPAGEQAEDAARAIRYLSSKGIQPEYLDVRVQNRAYYK